MSSIRRRLTVWLLGGLALLWLATGFGVYQAVRGGLIKSLDAQLAIDARGVRFLARGDDASTSEEGSRSRGGGRLQDRLPAYDDPEGGAFFQMWKEEGDVLERSASLGDFAFRFPDELDSDPRFETSVLGDGRGVRTMGFRVSAGGRGQRPGRGGGAATIVVIGREMRGVEQSLSSLLGGIALIGVLGAGGAVLLVNLALKGGLKPLRRLAAQTEAIDADSLGDRFDARDAPEELRPIYGRLNALLERLAASFERERRFSSDLAHEMRTPLAELKLISELALKWPDKSGAETHEEALAVINQMDTMVDSLLALARLDAGGVAERREPVNLSKLVEECWEPQSKLVQAKNLRVIWEKPSEPVILDSDPDLLRRIASNLLSNAAEYTPEGEDLAIGLSDGAFSVRNAAPGIGAEQVQHLFERYWRADPSRTGGKHAGLGLSLAQSCANALGMSLEAHLEIPMLEIQLSWNRA